MTANASADAGLHPVPSPAPAAAPAPSGKKRLVIGAVLGAAALGAAVYGYHWWTAGRFIETTDDAYVGADITLVAPKVSGHLAEVKVSDNQAVHAGEVLARIDDRDYRAALNKADAAVAAARAQIANLDAQRELQGAVIGQARAGMLASRAETARARDDQQRYRSLVAKAAVSVQSEQKADTAYKQAAAEDQKTQAQFTASTRELDVIATRKQQARAALQQVEAERELAALNLEYTVLRAPIDGVIGNRRARVGAYATVGNQLLSVVPARGLWVDANFKEDQLAHFRAGQRVTIRADVLPGQVFHGRLGSLAPATGAQFSVLPPENATGNFTKIVQRVPVRILLDEADGKLGLLRPGLSVFASIDTHAKGD
jgi:membrane fusion protein (multidrug efflux system)